MNKKIGMFLMVGAIALTGCNKKMGPFASDYFTTNPTPLEVVGDNVPATITANVPQKFFKKNAQVTVTPYLVFGNDSVARSKVKKLMATLRQSAMLTAVLSLSLQTGLTTPL